jgi:hypothetical protein
MVELAMVPSGRGVRVDRPSRELFEEEELMVDAGTGANSGLDAYRAGLQAAVQAGRDVDEPRIAFVYSSAAYDAEKVVRGVTSALPGTPVIGNTSFTGVITPDGYVGGDEGFAGVMVLGGSGIDVAVAGAPRGADARITGTEVANRAMAGRSTPPDYMHMVASPGEEEFFLKGVQKVVGRIPVFGGSAADNSISGDWKLFTSDGVYSDGVAVAFFWSDEPFANVFTGAYRETGDVGVVTKVDGNRRLVEIDHQPAVARYAEWTGVEPADLAGQALLVATITSPLGVKDRLGDLVAIRHPMNGNDDLSMNLGSNVAVNTAVIRMAASVDELIESTDATLLALQKRQPGPAAAYHLVHCGGRRAAMGERITEVADRIVAQAGGVPFIVEFTFGEYGYEDDGNNTCGGLMLSFTAIGR